MSCRGTSNLLPHLLQNIYPPRIAAMDPTNNLRTHKLTEVVLATGAGAKAAAEPIRAAMTADFILLIKSCFDE